MNNSPITVWKKLSVRICDFEKKKKNYFSHNHYLSIQFYSIDLGLIGVNQFRLGWFSLYLTPLKGNQHLHTGQTHFQNSWFGEEIVNDCQASCYFLSILLFYFFFNPDPKPLKN